MPSKRSLPITKLPQTYAGQLARMSFTEWVGKPAFAYRSAREWRQVTDAALDVAYRRLSLLREDTGGRLPSELDVLKKMTVCWRHKGFGSGYQPEGVSQPHRDKQLAWLRPALSKIVARVQKWITMNPEAIRDSVQAGYPVKKGKGAPFFLSAAHSRQVPALVRVHMGASTVEANWRCEQLAGFGVPMAGATYLRIQAAGKPVQRWTFTGSELVKGEKDFNGPKVRKVTGLPFAWNFWQAPVFSLLREAYVRSTGRGSGTLNHVLRCMTKGRFVAIAYDAKNFDDSVGLPTIDYLIEEGFDFATRALVSQGAMSPEIGQRARDCVRLASRTPVLTPPGRTSDGAVLLQNDDGVLSGLRGTSWLDTLFTAAVVETIGASLGLTLGVDYDYDTFGDDTIVFDYTGAELQWAKAFERANDEFGVTYERAPEAAYLMRRIPSLKPYASRMLLRTINREEREEPDSIAHATLGIKGRLDLLSGDAAAQRWYLDCLIAAGGPDGRLRQAATLAEGMRTADMPKLAAAAVRQARDPSLVYDDILETERKGGLSPVLTDWAVAAAQTQYQPWATIFEQAIDLPEDTAKREILKARGFQAEVIRTQEEYRR